MQRAVTIRDVKAPGRHLLDLLAAAALLLCIAILSLWIIAAHVGPIEAQWPAPTEPDGTNDPEYHLPRRSLRISSSDIASCAYIPQVTPIQVPHPRLYVSEGKGGFADLGPWRHIPNPAFQQFNATHPKWRQLWKFGPLWCDEELIDHVRWGWTVEVPFDSSILITGTQRAWHVANWLLLLVIGTIPAAWLAFTLQRTDSAGGPCPACGTTCRPSAAHCPQCGIPRAATDNRLGQRVGRLLVLATLLLSISAAAVWLATSECPALITWSSSSYKTYPPWDEGDYFFVLAQSNLGIGSGRICIAETHIVEHWGGMSALDADAYSSYVIETEKPEEQRRTEAETRYRFKRQAADTVASFDSSTMHNKWWERFGICLLKDHYSDLNPDNVCSGVRLPLWIFTLPAFVLLMFWMSRFLVRMNRRRNNRCVVCGYDLRGSSGRCPECGTSVANEAVNPAC